MHATTASYWCSIKLERRCSTLLNTFPRFCLAFPRENRNFLAATWAISASRMDSTPFLFHHPGFSADQYQKGIAWHESGQDTHGHMRRGMVCWELRVWELRKNSQKPWKHSPNSLCSHSISRFPQTSIHVSILQKQHGKCFLFLNFNIVIGHICTLGVRLEPGESFQMQMEFIPLHKPPLQAS